MDIENTGTLKGAEIVQIYYKDLESELDRPEKELCGFAKVLLKPEE